MQFSITLQSTISSEVSTDLASSSSCGGQESVILEETHPPWIQLPEKEHISAPGNPPGRGWEATNRKEGETGDENGM